MKNIHRKRKQKEADKRQNTNEMLQKNTVKCRISQKIKINALKSAKRANPSPNSEKNYKYTHNLSAGAAKKPFCSLGYGPKSKKCYGNIKNKEKKRRSICLIMHRKTL